MTTKTGDRGVGCLKGLTFLMAMLGSANAFAWAADGHHTVATIADKLVEGTKAATQVRAILGNTSLVDAAVWADCVKGVNPTTFKYEGAGTFPECKPFETPAGEAEMIDFVKRNATNCQRKPSEEICHKQYHYTDIAIQHDSYDPAFKGARTDDITAAIAAVVAVLQNGTAPAPFSIKNKREALLLLAHYVGDIHQPLHVGAVYLTKKGKPVNPDTGTFDPETDTRGGNDLIVTSTHAKLHGTWDVLPAALKPDQVNAAWLTKAKGVSRTAGPVQGWSRAWASDTQKQAIKAFAKLTFGSKKSGTWSTKLPSGYEKTMTALKEEQLTRGGARLAQLLTALWPEANPPPAAGGPTPGH
jgi:hypothetical protein